MLSINHLSKRYGETIAVNDLDFEVPAGVVTGFLGPNGSGKSTTMRVIMGLDRPSAGTATMNGQTYDQMKSPLHEVGALLDAKALDPKRSARNHLRALALANRIGFARVDEVLEFVGVASVAHKKVGGFSLGMSQRLGIAAAVLGDPGILLFDEPVNGLDPEGIRWIRDFFRSLAKEGRTVFVSSHLMSEMAVSADEIIVIGRGKFITSGTVDQLTTTAAGTVFVRSSDDGRLIEALSRSDAQVECEGQIGLDVIGLTSEHIGEIAFGAGLVIYELTERRASLEDVFMTLTADAVEYGHHSSKVGQ